MVQLIVKTLRAYFTPANGAGVSVPHWYTKSSQMGASLQPFEITKMLLQLQTVYILQFTNTNTNTC